MRGSAERVRAWRPTVPGIVEVFHAHFVEHVYPMHTHDAWTVLIVDSGAIHYDLDRSEHGTRPAEVTLLPPYVAHDGRAATEHGFSKRVIYLDAAELDPAAIGAAVDAPGLRDPTLRDRIDTLHRTLAAPGDELEAESRLVLIRDRLRAHLRPKRERAEAGSRTVADELRDLLDAAVTTGLTLRDAAARLGVRPTHLVRSFTAAFGVAPHAYLIGRRVDLARRLLLDGQPIAQAATAAGFYDQAHLTRHFRRYLGVSPGRYTR